MVTVHNKFSIIINIEMIKDNIDTQGTSSKLILGLIGSPRKLGNCEIFVKEISRHINIDHTLCLIRLPSLKILPCKACYGCIMDKPCPNKDDMEFLLHQITQSDAMIVASPVYFLGSHSIFKSILDRGFLFYHFLQKTYGKPCILVNMYGIKERIGVAPQTLRSFASFLGLNIKGSVNVKAALPGEVIMDKKNCEKAKKLAEALFSKKMMKNRYGCPFCGCEVVRMEKKRFICTLCHGSFSTDHKGNKVKISEGGIFGNPEHMLLHKEWLRGMKNRFLEKRKEILKTIIPYRDMGEWIEP
ncbi:MAG: flavodoxin family protein [Proteobacteria bacterium]|nr:flavodoxin family protein [Pseudomonadota bacterium]